jgi:RND family efflux transporter MFP subunit
VKTKLLFVVGIAAALVLGYSMGHRPQAPKTQGREPLYYVDPMHPAYHSDKPGKAPDCGMELEPVYADQLQAIPLGGATGKISITPERQQLIGISTEQVRKNAGTWLLRTSGRVEADNSRVYRLMAATAGWVQSSESRPPGTLVKKDDPLATFYSEEFRNAQQAYISSLVSQERVKGPRELEDKNALADTSLRINEERLRALGMGEAQIKELARTRKTTRDITLSSPVDGIVLANNVTLAQRFEKGEELYRIADLSNVWIMADVLPNQAKALHPGTRIKVIVPELGRAISATVTPLPPMFDAASRTVKIRLQANNPGLAIRPDMFVDVEFSAPLPKGLFIPREAVLDTGTQKIVYVEQKDGEFAVRKIEVGQVYGDTIAVLAGLNEGERVVASGQFLIDSETRMRSGAIVQASAKTSEAMERDPVCGMTLNGSNPSKHIASYKGETYSFCSEKCQKKFEQSPAAYVTDKLGRAVVPESAAHD